MASKNYYVYLHRRADTGQIFYVGKGKGRRAWSLYRSDLWKRYTNKYPYTVEIFADNLQEWYALELEEDLILKYGRRSDGGCLLNFTSGNFKITEHIKYSKTTCEKISTALKGKKKTKEHLQKIGESMKKTWKTRGHPFQGKHHSAGSRGKISAAKKGSFTGSSNPFSKKIQCIETGEIFGSLVEAQEWYVAKGLSETYNTGSLTSVLRGEYKQYLGYSWRYVEKESL